MLKNRINMMVGMPRLRQLRGPNGTECKGLPAQDFLACIAPYSNENNVKSRFFMGWKDVTPDVDRYSERAREQFWKYHNFSDTKSNPTQGDTFIFTGGGYIANLGRYTRNMNITIHFLKRHSWIDDFTGVVVLEVCLYNMNGYLTLVNVVFERDVSGFFYFSSSIIASVNLNKYPVSNNLMMEIAFALVSCAIVYYQIMALQIYSFKKYFRDWWSIYDILLSFVVLATVAMYLIRRTKILRMFYIIDQLQDHEYLAIEEGYFVNKTFLTFLGILIFLVTVRLTKVFMQFFCFKTIEITLYIEIMALIFLIIFTLIVLYSCSISVYLAFREKYRIFKTPIFALPAVTALLFGNQEIISIRNLWFYQFFFGLILFISTLILHTFRAVLLQAYTVAKGITKRTYNYGYCDYFREECQYHCKIRRRSYKMKTRRLRAGADEYANALDPVGERRRHPDSRIDGEKSSPTSGAKSDRITLDRKKRIIFSNFYTPSNKNPSVLFKMKEENEEERQRVMENLRRVIQTEIKKDDERKTRSALMERVGSVLTCLKRGIRETSLVLDVPRERRNLSPK